MHTMAPACAAELHACRVRLTTGPAAAAEAYDQGRTAICAWDASVARDIAVLLTSELAANAIWHTAGEAATLGVRCVRIQLRVDVQDTSSCRPVLADAGEPDPRDRRRAGVRPVASAAAWPDRAENSVKWRGSP